MSFEVVAPIRVTNHEHYNIIGHPGWNEFWLDDDGFFGEVLESIGEGKWVRVFIEVVE